ncbi:hypothetical protein LA6_003694 [Marinibacterium anthonyi]|nr:hypothetical protein LA6_003694 [Marinibacterium anthonyi]
MYNFHVNFEDEQRLERLSETFAKHAQDFDDLQNEMAGRDVGQIERFLPGTAMGSRASERKRAERAEALTRLQLLMADKFYAQQHALTVQHLNDAQDRLDTVLERVQREIELTELTLDEKRDRAARLEDGTRVYRDQHGNVRTEAGDKISDDLADGVVWNGSEPTYESIQADHDRIERLRAIESDAHAGQGRIGGLRNDLDNEDDPPSTEDMDSIRKDADGIVEGIEARLDAETTTRDMGPETLERDVATTADIKVPQL